MRFLIKLLISVVIIVLCTQIGRRLPTLAGLIAVMPLTGAIVLVWLYIDNPSSHALLTQYAKAALWGILPSIMFFLTVFLCFQKQLPLPITLCISFTIWIIFAVFHQLLLCAND